MILGEHWVALGLQWAERAAGVWAALSKLKDVP